ncbi:YybH family protein [Methylolobus aquaticus]|uniref:YybH family protein n=1 Tax=Methylotetracoccus oryzae TaxID=1919059 RepID=UPI00111B1B4A|nr:nuclear transport factor 2 family protein [Methylotetracoccus oryzae]
MKRLRISSLLAAMAAAGSVHAETAHSVAEMSAARWNTALAHRQLDEILALYTGDAMLLRPDGEVSRNPAQIRAFWQSLMQSGEFAVDVVGAHSEKEDTIVVTTTFSEIKRIGTSTPGIRYQYDGVLYNVLQRQPDGSWKARIQRWSGPTKS